MKRIWGEANMSSMGPGGSQVQARGDERMGAPTRTKLRKIKWKWGRITQRAMKREGEGEREGKGIGEREPLALRQGRQRHDEHQIRQG